MQWQIEIQPAGPRATFSAPLYAPQGVPKFPAVKAAVNTRTLGATESSVGSPRPLSSAAAKTKPNWRSEASRDLGCWRFGQGITVAKERMLIFGFNKNVSQAELFKIVVSWSQMSNSELPIWTMEIMRNVRPKTIVMGIWKYGAIKFAARRTMNK